MSKAIYKIWFIFIITKCNLAFSQNQESEINTQSNPLINHCISIVNDVVSNGNIIGNLNPDSLGSLPIGLAKSVGGSQIIIAIDSASFIHNSAKFNAYAALDLPGSADKIAFRGQNIEFNPKGIIGGANSRLVLVSDHRIKIGPKITLVLKAYDNNYVLWNCNGFEKVHLKGYFEFSRDMIIPDATSGNMSDFVTAAFEIEVPDLHNFVTQISISPFMLSNLRDISFSATEAIVDMSELSNASNMIFPPGYNFNGAFPSMWQGFYLKHLKVKLPKELSQKGQDRKEVYVSNFLIDNSGVSGNFQLTNVLAEGQGDMSGWGFSINSLGITILQNHINGGSIIGDLEIPISDDTKFGYNAIVSENPTTKQTDFLFSINPKNNINANLFSAKIDLYNTSVIKVVKANQKFIPEAKLNGKIIFNSKNFKTGDLDFQDIHIITAKPIFVGGTFAHSSSNNTSNNAAGFPIGINSIVFQFAQNIPPKIYINAGLQFKQENDGGGLSANCGIIIKTKYSQLFQSDGSIETLNKLQFDKIQLNDIMINIQTDPIGLEGKVVFYDNDPTFGKGFMGSLKLNVKPAGILVMANAAFGAKNTYKYFYVDGAAKMPSAVPLCFALGMWGFKGGLYYHMSPVITTPLKNGMVNLMQSPPSSIAVMKTPYIPDSTTNFGFKAGIMFGLIGKDDIMNGDIDLEIKFNPHGGVNLIQMKGDVALMCSINDKMTKPSNQIPIYGTTDSYYDFVNNTLHMTNNIIFNYKGAISGSGQNVVHFEPSKWYVYIGKPSAKVNIKVYNIASAASYFMVGTEVEPMPPPPSYVGINYNDTRNTSLVSSGNGFVAGASLSVDMANQFGVSFFQVYYSLHAGVGFDVMLGKYKTPYRCAGSQDPPGFRGWFSQGQIWAYINGNIGVKGSIDVDVGGVSVSKDFDFTLVALNFAANISGKMPNPIYLEGFVQCNYTILQVVSGNFDFRFNSGKDCNLVVN